MTQFGAGQSFLAQCPPTPPAPDGYTLWMPSDGAVPPAASARAVAIAFDMSKPLGYEENVGGLLLRVEPHTWTIRNGVKLVGCFHGVTVYKPAPVVAPTSSSAGGEALALLLSVVGGAFALAGPR